jgi:hypothetical protein
VIGEYRERFGLGNKQKVDPLTQDRAEQFFDFRYSFGNQAETMVIRRPNRVALKEVSQISWFEHDRIDSD